MSRLNPLSLIVSLAVSPFGVRVELEGGHVFEYHRQEPTERPSLPPGAPVITTTAEPVAPTASAPALRLVRRAA